MLQSVEGPVGYRFGLDELKSSGRAREVVHQEGEQSVRHELALRLLAVVVQHGSDRLEADVVARSRYALLKLTKEGVLFVVSVAEDVKGQSVD